MHCDVSKGMHHVMRLSPHFAGVKGQIENRAEEGEGLDEATFFFVCN